MTPDIVVDIGNTRIKWGYPNSTNTMQVSRLDPDDPAAWQSEINSLSFDRPIRWAIASVHPTRLERFVEWCITRGDEVRTIRSRHDVPISVAIREPDSVGLDRLLGAVAANARRRAGCPAITIDIGTAVTLNAISDDGRFWGGAILPGKRMMAKALHQFTAKLPLIDTDQAPPQEPGQNTAEAIQLGIDLAVQGAIRSYCVMFTEKRYGQESTDYFVTGGGAAQFNLLKFQHVPTLNLEGIRIAAEAMA